jgi:hypothetical protein
MIEANKINIHTLLQAFHGHNVTAKTTKATVTGKLNFIPNSEEGSAIHQISVLVLTVRKV